MAKVFPTIFVHEINSPEMEKLGINTHGSIETGISKMRGRKPINLQAAKAIGLPTKKR